MQSIEAQHAVYRRQHRPVYRRPCMQSIEAAHAVYRRQGMQSIEGSACSL